MSRFLAAPIRRMVGVSVVLISGSLRLGCLQVGGDGGRKPQPKCDDDWVVYPILNWCFLAEEDHCVSLLSSSKSLRPPLDMLPRCPSVSRSPSMIHVVMVYARDSEMLHECRGFPRLETTRL